MSTELKLQLKHIIEHEKGHMVEDLKALAAAQVGTFDYMVVRSNMLAAEARVKYFSEQLRLLTGTDEMVIIAAALGKLPVEDAFSVLRIMVRHDPRLVLDPSVRLWCKQNAKAIIDLTRE